MSRGWSSTLRSPYDYRTQQSHLGFKSKTTRSRLGDPAGYATSPHARTMAGKWRPGSARPFKRQPKHQQQYQPPYKYEPLPADYDEPLQQPYDPYNASRHVSFEVVGKEYPREARDTQEAYEQELEQQMQQQHLHQQPQQESSDYPSDLPTHVCLLSYILHVCS